MAHDVAYKIDNSDTGKDGVAIVNINGFKIVPDDDSYILSVPSGISEEYNTVNDVTLSGRYVDRFDDPKYYTS